jgi:putative transposase
MSLTADEEAQIRKTVEELDKDCPDPRPIMQRRIGKVVAVPQVGGLHHRYERIAS